MFLMEGSDSWTAPLVDDPIRRPEPRFTNVRLNLMDIEVDGTAGDYMLITDGWSRDWTATINGINTPVTRANGAFKALPLVSGRNIIRLRFLPEAYAIALVIYLLSLAVGVILLNFKETSLESPVDSRL